MKGEKEASKVKSRLQNNPLLHRIISELKQGKNPAKISKKLNISKQLLQYHLRRLKKDGVIVKEGYGIWKVLKEVKSKPKAYKNQKQIRGHAFNWNVTFKHNIDWKKRLEKTHTKYQLVGALKTTPRVIFNGKKIWFTKSGLIIYEPSSFFAESSFTSKGLAVYELDKTIKMLGRHLKIDLSTFWFTTSREHYGQVENILAKQYNDKGEKLHIRHDGKLWLWADDSHSLSELETNDPIVSRQVQNWWNDHKKNNFEVTPSFTLEVVNKIAQNQMIFDRNIKKHQQVLDSMLSVLSKIEKRLDKL